MISVVGPPQFLLHPVSDLRSGGELEMEMICQFALFPAAPLIFSNLHISKCLICKNLKHSHHLKHGGLRVVGHWYFVIFWPIAQMLLRCWIEGNMNQLMVKDFRNAIHCSSISQVHHTWLVWFPNPLSAGARLFRSQMSSLVHDQQHQNADEGIFRRRLGIQFFPILLLLLLLTLLPSFSCPKIDTVKNMIIGFGGTGGACAFLGHFPSTFLRLFETISILFYDSDWKCERNFLVDREKSIVLYIKDDIS